MKLRSPASSAPRGFALASALLLFTLLIVVALGLLTVSTVSLRGSRQGELAREARANARLALNLAIAQLQSLAGPDQRITASSSVLGSLPQNHLTGVWRGWKWDPGTTPGPPDWKQEKDSRFLGWLVSSPVPSDTAKLDFARSPAPGNKVTLLGGGEPVEASLVPIDGNHLQQLAWFTSDESAKASVRLADRSAESFAEAYRSQSAASRFHWQGIAPFESLEENPERAPRRLSLPQLRFSGIPSSAFLDHDLTTHNLGLLTDAATGGLARDLSLLFDRSTLPEDFSRRFLYSDQDSPLAPAPARFDGAMPLPSPDPTWAALHHHFRSYTRFDASNPLIDASVQQVVARPADSGADLSHHQAFTRPALAPVIAKAQFVFSLAFGYQPETLPNMWANGGARQSPPDLRDEYITWLVIDPVITLWNPYNLPMRFTGARIELYRIPLAYRIYKNGQLINSDYTRLTNAHTAEDFKTRENRFYRLNVLPEEGTSELILAPGEHVVFTAHNHKMHGGHDYNLTGVDLRPGFHPPAGNASDLEVGGVTTQNIFVNASGASSGRDYERTVRTVAVKAGDRIQIEVRADHAAVDQIRETGGREITGFLKYFLGGGNVTRLLGAIEVDYGNRERELLPSFAKEDLPTIVVSPEIPKGSTAGLNPARHALRFKEPFLLTTFQQKTERDSKFSSRSWIHNAPTNLYASAGLDQTEPFEHQQYEFKWEAMTDWPPNSPTIEISNTRNRGFGGSGIYAQSGAEFATFASLPIAPLNSIPQLRHAPLNTGGQLPLTTQIVGNSYLQPLLGPSSVIHGNGDRTYFDHSFLANQTLFDSWFFSSAASQPSLPGQEARSSEEILRRFFLQQDTLPNPRFLPTPSATAHAEDLARELSQSPDAYRRLASHLLLDGPFNVNSTRVDAWRAFLSSNFGQPVPQWQDGQFSLLPGAGLPVLRHHHVTRDAVESSSESSSADLSRWNGFRRLSSAEIDALARHLVREITRRGPFLSVAEFVNRQPGDDTDNARSGALQAAIDRSGVNREVLDPQFDLSNGEGNTADGAPAVIQQADLLTPLAPLLVARGDTFRIRVYGEARDRDGSIARAWAEAVVQRLPEFVDPADAPHLAPTRPANLRFGRRLILSSFRYLHSEEI